jgi:adenylosuccinate lyase
MSYPISALDGRYSKKVSELSLIASEFGLMRYRLQVEVAWLLFLKEHHIVPASVDLQHLATVVEKFDDAEFEKIKTLEATTKHDVKAVEYYLRDFIEEKGWSWIHFACTSEDINNLAYALVLKDSRDVVAQVLHDAIIANLRQKAKEWKSIPMLARTHGQPATPTTMGKELGVYVHRLESIETRLQSVAIMGKINGATGNYAAHSVAFPDVDWITLSKRFIESLGLSWNPLTTQIENHDYQSEMLDHISRLCSVLCDLCTDIWGYISIGYFGQKTVAGEIGSSTMPHKVNPIDFENARGNFKLTRGIARTLSDELPISMWQRDLSDSTLQRNFGLMFGHFLLGLKSLETGLLKIEIKEEVLQRDLSNNPEVLTEAIQTVLRKNGHSDAYEQLKELSRGKKITLEEIHTFIQTLEITDADKEVLLALTPETYIGKSTQLVELFL